MHTVSCTPGGATCGLIGQKENSPLRAHGGRREVGGRILKWFSVHRREANDNLYSLGLMWNKTSRTAGLNLKGGLPEDGLAGLALAAKAAGVRVIAVL